MKEERGKRKDEAEGEGEVEKMMKRGDEEEKEDER